MDLKRGAAYWASSMAGLFLLLAFPALFDGIEGLRWPAFFVLILKAVFYAVLGALLLASFHWQPAVTSGTVALVELIRIFSCVIFLMDTWDFSQIPVFILCIMFFIASLIFAVIHYGRTKGYKGGLGDRFLSLSQWPRLCNEREALRTWAAFGNLKLFMPNVQIGEI